MLLIEIINYKLIESGKYEIKKYASGSYCFVCIGVLKLLAKKVFNYPQLIYIQQT